MSVSQSSGKLCVISSSKGLHYHLSQAYSAHANLFALPTIMSLRAFLQLDAQLQGLRYLSQVQAVFLVDQYLHDSAGQVCSLRLIQDFLLAWSVLRQACFDFAAEYYSAFGRLLICFRQLVVLLSAAHYAASSNLLFCFRPIICRQPIVLLSADYCSAFGRLLFCFRQLNILPSAD